LATAQRFAVALEREGFSVWWDQALNPGEAYDHVTEKALREAKAVIVLWSRKSVESRWVRAEATLAERNKTLVPAMIEPCERPIMFELIQTADLSHWNGSASDPAWRSYVAGVRRMISQASGPSADVQRIVASAETLDKLKLALPEQTSVAILPLQFIGNQSKAQILAEGLTHEIITQVAMSGWLFVASGGSTSRFRAGPYDAREIGRALGVHFVVQGRVQLAGKQLRVQVALANALDGSELWGDDLQRRLDDIFEMQREISETIAGTLSSRIEHIERRHALQKPPQNLGAWEAYHRGAWHMYRSTQADLELAKGFFEQCIALDPSSSRGYAGLSFVHWQYAFLELTPDRNAECTRAMELAKQSLTLDPYEPQGHWAAGRAHLLTGNFAQAVEELETCAKLNPSSAVFQYSLAFALTLFGDPQRSDDLVSKARRLSPFDPMTYAMFGVRAQNLALLGQYEEAADFGLRAAEQPNVHHHVLAIGAYCNLLAGRHAEALVLYRRVLAARPGYSVQDFLRACPFRRKDQVQLVKGAFDGLRALHLDNADKQD
jgi:TolB-like protein